MTPLTTIQFWSREQLESAFTQREVQLVASNNAFAEMEASYLNAKEEVRLAQQQLAQAQARCKSLEDPIDEGWLSPDEAKLLMEKIEDALDTEDGKERDVLRAELNRWQNAFAMFKGTPEELAQWAVRDANEAKRLEADAACLREALKQTQNIINAPECESDDQARANTIIDEALATTAGRSLVERLEQLQADLHEAAELLGRATFYDDADLRLLGSFLAKISTVAPETKTTK